MRHRIVDDQIVARENRGDDAAFGRSINSPPSPRRKRAEAEDRVIELEKASAIRVQSEDRSSWILPAACKIAYRSCFSARISRSSRIRTDLGLSPRDTPATLTNERTNFIWLSQYFQIQNIEYKMPNVSSWQKERITSQTAGSRPGMHAIDDDYRFLVYLRARGARKRYSTRLIVLFSRAISELSRREPLRAVTITKSSFGVGVYAE